MKKALIIQTAFIGDAILATALAESIHQGFPNAEVHFVVREECVSLFKGHPYVTRVFGLDKKKKYRSLKNIIGAVRKEKYDAAFSLGRFGSSGIVALFTRSVRKFGFEKSVYSFVFDVKYPHEFKENWHEINRNFVLLSEYKELKPANPKLYPSVADYEKIRKYSNGNYFCLAPSSVWFTKQLPKEKWVELCNSLANKGNVYLLGAAGDKELCEEIAKLSTNKNVFNLCGEINLLQSAALMQSAEMNYVNDSAPMHLCSAMNANTTAFYCSTVPEFGFGPLSANSKVIQVQGLECKPCGLHGRVACPLGHFKCGNNIIIES